MFKLSILLLQGIIVHNLSVHQKILDWWTKVSIQKPLKCQTHNRYNEPLLPQATKFMNDIKSVKVLNTRQCNAFDTNNLDHTFRGNSSNGKFEGNSIL